MGLYAVERILNATRVIFLVTSIVLKFPIMGKLHVIFPTNTTMTIMIIVMKLYVLAHTGHFHVGNFHVGNFHVGNFFVGNFHVIFPEKHHAILTEKFHVGNFHIVFLRKHPVVLMENFHAGNFHVIFPM